MGRGDAGTSELGDALELFRQHSSLGKRGKEEPWTLEIISYWSDKLSSILDYFTFDPRKKSILPIQRKSQVLFVYHVLESPRVSELRSPPLPRSRVPTSHVPRPRPTFSDSPQIKLLTTLMTEICGWKAFHTAQSAKHFRKFVRIVTEDKKKV